MCSFHPPDETNPPGGQPTSECACPLSICIVMDNGIHEAETNSLHCRVVCAKWQIVIRYSSREGMVWWSETESPRHLSCDHIHLHSPHIVFLSQLHEAFEQGDLLSVINSFGRIYIFVLYRSPESGPWPEPTMP